MQVTLLGLQSFDEEVKLILQSMTIDLSRILCNIISNTFTLFKCVTNRSLARLKQTLSPVHSITAVVCDGETADQTMYLYQN